jgi:lysophospholipase L1-like esterase
VTAVGAAMEGAVAEGALDPAAFLRGGPADPGAGRLAEQFRAKLPYDTWDTSVVPAGVRLELVSHAEALVLVLATAERHAMAAPTMPDAVSVWRDGERVATVPVAPGGGAVTVPLSPDGATYTLHLPEALRPRVTALVPLGGGVVPAERGLRWIAYGDSITQGWSATDPGLTYPSIAARRLGLDVWNLGFAGSARGETVVAQQIAELEADVISLAFGTNNWSAIPTGPVHLAGLLADFVAVIRGGHPGTPIVVLSPIVRPSAEQALNPVGATLVQLRDALAAEARRLAAADPALVFLDGAELVAPEQLADGIHPDDDGHRAMADALAPALAALLGAPIEKVTT